MSNKNLPEFTFGSDEGSAPQTVTGIAPVDAYIVQYRDQEGKPQWRIAFHAPNENPEKDAAFLLQTSVGGKSIVSSTSDWFRTQFTKRVRRFLGRGQSSQEDTGVSQV